LRGNFRSGKRWLKAEMHAHCNLDPQDYGISQYSPEQLIRAAAGQGYEILSITCHDVNIWSEKLSDYARSHGITLIPGMEVTTERTRHTLVYNIDKGPESLDTLEKIRKLSREEALIVAPHPFYPGRTCLRGYLEKNPDLFDAVEYSGFLVRSLNFNRRMMTFSKRTGKTVLACGDIHHLWQLGKTYTWIYAEPEIQSIVYAIKQGQVRIETTPLTWFEAAGWWATALCRKILPANSPPRSVPSDKIENGRRFGTSQERMESQSIHVGQ
jgi:predicted metal-dependent phosphoesterase TrpH